jgi:predicted RNA binding protein YcfA (HicA-like mRNA interferase family)
MAERLPRVTADRALRALLRHGWYIVDQEGSHVRLRHPDKPGRHVTIARHAGKIVKLKTLKSILNQAGLTVDEFRRML